ncbi:MAG: hypothetical protein PHD04_00150 [Candidatus Pacebacteria bacterium]|nr:hypothetical protein [Candidatus Paceibacterota bacterium]
MDVLYSVHVEEFAERYFIKKFHKKYQEKWDTTLIAIKAELSRIDNLLLSSRATTIAQGDDVKIIKTEFRVVGTKESAKSSGNRCIVAWHPKELSVSVLLVYNKTDLSGKNETAEWQDMIRENYPQYKSLF